MSELSDLLRDLDLAEEPLVEARPEDGAEDLFIQARAAIGRRDLSPATRRFLETMSGDGDQPAAGGLRSGLARRWFARWPSGRSLRRAVAVDGKSPGLRYSGAVAALLVLVLASSEVGALTHLHAPVPGVRRAPGGERLACPWVEPGNLGVQAHAGAERPKVEWRGSCVQVWVTASSSAGQPDLIRAVAASFFVPPSQVTILTPESGGGDEMEVTGLNPFPD